MIGYITLGADDIEATGAFYDKLFAQLPVVRVYEYEKFIAWGTSTESILFCITKPFDGEKSSVGNGVMIALKANSTVQVDALYELALSLGAQDEGAPGLRSGNYYCAYFRDPSGNKINFHYIDNNLI